MSETTSKNLKTRIEKLNASKFTKDCYFQLARIPKGKVVTYKSLAKSLKSKAFRAVGSAMRKNPLAPLLPCHRVVNSDGRIGQYAFGQKNKINLLKSEGIEIVNGKVVNLKKYLHS